MYLFKKNIIKLIKIKINFLLILSFLFFYVSANAEEKFVGFIESLEGNAFKTSNEGKIKLNVFDQIFINDEITLGSNANATISFLDNSIFTLNRNSTFIVKDFDNISQDPKFIILVSKGSFTFESGTIAKNKNGIMKINLSEMEVVLNGTLITGSNTGEEKRVALIEDSMGKVGSLSITVGDQTTEISDPSQGISLSGNNEIEETNLSEEETNQVKSFIKKATVDAQTDTEENISRAVAKQLAAGTIPDANGDGIMDADDMDLYKAQLFEFKGTRMGYYMEMSDGNDMGLMSDMIRYSDPSQSMQLMQGMMDYDPANAALMMGEVTQDGFDVFSHMNNAGDVNGNMIYRGGDANFEDVRAALVSGMMQDTSGESIETMARVMAVSDPSMSSYMLNEITDFTGNNSGNNLSMNVLASFTEMAPDKMDSYMQADPSMMNNFTQSAFQNANEGDATMIADMMQQTSGKNSAYLMSSMMENNDTMISSVYGNLADQDFDIFNHIESAKTASTIISDDPFPTPGTDPFPTPGTDPTGIMASQANFYDNLKGQIFTEIINNSDQTAAEATAGLMMNSEGDSAMFMMETMMETNPEIIGEVMQGFVEDDFDIFDHFEDTAINEPIDTITPEDNEISNLVGLTKEERKAERQRIKAIKKADRLIAREERKASRKAARLAAKQAAQETGFATPIETNSDLQEFKTEVFKDMMTYSNDNTMGTMAMLVAGADEQTASLIFETVVSEQNSMSADGAVPTNNFALDLMNNLSSGDSGMMDTMYETQGDLVNNMMTTAMTNISSDDSAAIANIISSSGNDEMNAMVFNNIVSSNDQSLTSNVFTNLADTESGSDAIMTIASTNQSLYENMAQDVDPTYMTAASLLADTTATYNTNTAVDTTTAAATDTTTYAAGAISWTTYPTSPGIISTTSYVSVSGTASSKNGVTYSASDLPDGLTLDYTTGMIFGTPTAAGIWNTTLTATDMMDFNSFATASITFDIVEDNTGGAYNDPAGGGTLSFMSTPYPPATLTVNNPITPIYLYTSGGTGNITYSASGLPLGLSVSITGSIIGSPDTQTFTSSSVTIIATDEDGNTASTNLTFPQVDSGAAASGGANGPSWSTYVYGPTTLTTGTEMMDMYLDATGTGTVNFTASNLPMGLYVDGQYIKGTPSMQTAYTSSVMITATDDMGSQTKFVTFPMVNANGGGGSVTWNTLAADFSTLTLTEGTPMSSINLSASGVGTITYSDDAFLPAGISLTAGVVSGTPTSSTATETSVTFTATDSNGNTEDLFVSFPAINASGGGSNPTFTTNAGDVTTSLGSLTQNSSITSFSIGATGGMSPISYSATGLPTGLSLSSTGVLSGTPTVPGTGASVTFRATDMNSLTDSFSLIFPTITAAGGGISNPSWSTEPSFNASYTTSDNFSITASATSSPPANGVNYSATGLPMGVTIDSNSGLISGSTTMTGSYNVTVTAQDVMDATYQVSTALLSFTVTEGGGAETVDFTTAETLPSANAGQNINETVVATGSQGSMPTYSFISASNTGNAFGLSGTAITVTGNQISGIAPRLLNAATYSFEIQASIQGGTVTNNRTFTLLISQNATCVSPIDNICT